MRIQMALNFQKLRIVRDKIVAAPDYDIANIEIDGPWNKTIILKLDNTFDFAKGFAEGVFAIQNKDWRLIENRNLEYVFPSEQSQQFPPTTHPYPQSHTPAQPFVPLKR